jgi:hypothetical protein
MNISDIAALSSQKRRHVIPAVSAALVLFAALADWPYGYYQFLRLVVCGVGIYIAVLAYHWRRIWAVWLFGITATLFNPFVPVHLSKNLWQPIDVGCAALFLAGAFLLRPEANHAEIN